MLTKLNIPDKIKVGFQKRSDTYTGNLAYVVYYDSKGTLRKEKSWSNWRDNKIDPQEFDNVPTSGFVLNKKVGETRWGWNPRKAWVRVYDPRDFEFEISVANLLFILEECSSIKGKGLEGEFIYSWDGTELVLLPVSSQEYQSSVNYTALQTKKLTKEDMVPGCIYRTKDNEQVIYLGRHDWYELTTDYESESSPNYTTDHFGYVRAGYSQYRYFKTKYLKHSRQHIFVSTDGKSTYWTQKGYTKLAERLSDEPSPMFAEEFEKFKKSIYASKPIKIVDKPKKLKKTKNAHYGSSFFLKKGSEYYVATVRRDYQGNYHFAVSNTPIKQVKELQLRIPDSTGRDNPITEDELKQLELCALFIQNEQGALVEV